MNIRQAILAAAAHIEANPGEFDFYNHVVPNSRGCQSPGCAIGWIAVFSGKELLRHHDGMVRGVAANCPLVLGVTDDEFYGRMAAVCGSHDWKLSAPICARALRYYADAYHPAAPLLYPNWSAMAAVRTIGDDVADTVRA